MRREGEGERGREISFLFKFDTFECLKPPTSEALKIQNPKFKIQNPKSKIQNRISRSCSLGTALYFE